MEINEIFVKIPGRMPAFKSFHLGDDVNIAGVFTVVKLEEKDRQDGTKDVIWSLKLTDGELAKADVIGSNIKEE